ncbi:hypothetical protein ABID82_002359 [Methylobacterium sp. PvP062]|uniref:Uncharacterized protein n=1 Tax=Methylobacterium radiotolerans TaxID=31998 RepID=A0ABV2NN86_9HYPH|nr:MULTISPECIES: hypothetical protein [unclassified Methylobacterium]MBP2495309.1 hypothetical protein [Methylobacterium sp. PvP105]MBP2504820.1 hypothetical protein [Methylobacterium sp. PvP109]MCX7335827.1 hypothetical protein [Hyphomicrobiales bacterium]
MGAFDWSTQAVQNATADADVPARDGTSARDLPALVRDLMAAQAAVLADQGGAIVTGGLANAYLARTASGVPRIRPGIAILIQADRDNTGSPTLNVDSMGARPWRHFDGSAPPPGRIQAGAFYLVVASGNAWVSDFGGIDEGQAEDIAITAALIFGGI